VAAHVHPQARVGEGQALAQSGATAMMDLSDGVSIDLARLCRASGVGGAVVLSHVPVAGALRELERVLPVEPLQLALEGGEDFELLATLPAEVVKEAAAEIEAAVRFARESPLPEPSLAATLVYAEATGP